MTSLLRSRGRTRVPTFGSEGEGRLVARGVCVSYDGQEVVKAVDLDICPGEVVAVVGPNGAGKSTLIAALAGDVSPARGSVSIDGQALAGWTADELAIRRSVLLQRIDVSFPFTVLDVVRMGRAPWHGTVGQAQDDRAVAEAMAAAGVTSLAGRVFTSLSGGEQALAALARVLAQETQVLLLDEPTAALDIAHVEMIMTVVRNRARAGRAVGVALHDLSSAAAHSDRVVVMSEGAVVADGPPGDVLTSKLLTEVYRHPVDVFSHPRTGSVVVTPFREDGP